MSRPSPDPRFRHELGNAEAKRVIRIIAAAIPQQGPPQREDRVAAIEILRTLYQHGYRVVEREPVSPAGVPADQDRERQAYEEGHSHGSAHRDDDWMEAIRLMLDHLLSHGIGSLRAALRAHEGAREPRYAEWCDRCGYERDLHPVSNSGRYCEAFISGAPDREPEKERE